jgi:hypothetical protein
VPGRALLLVIVIAAALATPAYADDSVQFTLGRVVHTTPDARDRVGIRSSCDEPSGCKVLYTLMRGTRSIGGIDALLIGSTVQTDYVTLTKRMAASLRRRRTVITITAQVSDPEGNKATFTKRVTLGPKKKR